MEILRAGQKRAREAAAAADDAEATVADLRLQHQAGEKAAQDAEARAFNLLLDLKSAEKKAKSLRETSNRLNPEPTLDSPENETMTSEMGTQTDPPPAPQPPPEDDEEEGSPSRE